MLVEKILIIDDEDDIRKVATLSLVRIGKFQVITASSGEEGLKVAATEKPDLIILDMMMPGMDGLTVFSRMKGDPLTTSIPIVFMTAKAQAHEKEDYRSRGAAGVIEKPFDPMKLPEEVRKIAAAI